MENNTDNNKHWDDNYTNKPYNSTSPTNNSNSWSSQSYQDQLPAHNSAMTLAIIATCLFVICCCFGGPYIAFILSLIGFFIAHSSTNTYKNNPEAYDANSYKRVNNAKIFNLVVVIVSALIILLSLVNVFNTNSFLDDPAFDDLLNDHDHYEDDYYEEEPSDTWYYEDEEEIDSIPLPETAPEMEEETPLEEAPSTVE